MNAVSAALLVIPGVIHVLPLSGVLGGQRLAALYGVEITDPNLIIMLQHRAVLFGILGLFLIVSAFHGPFQKAAIIAGLASTVSFIVIAFSAGGYNESIHRVVIADAVAIVCLLGAAAALVRKPRAS